MADFGIDIQEHLLKKTGIGETPDKGGGWFEVTEHNPPKELIQVLTLMDETLQLRPKNRLAGSHSKQGVAKWFSSVETRIVAALASAKSVTGSFTMDMSKQLSHELSLHALDVDYIPVGLINSAINGVAPTQQDKDMRTKQYTLARDSIVANVVRWIYWNALADDIRGDLSNELANEFAEHGQTKAGTGWHYKKIKDYLSEPRHCMERDLLHDLFEQDFVGLLKAPKEGSYGDICRKMQGTAIRLVKMITNNDDFNPATPAHLTKNFKGGTLLNNAKRLAIGIYAGRLAPVQAMRESLRSKYWEVEGEAKDAQDRPVIHFDKYCPDAQRVRLDGTVHRHWQTARQKLTATGVDPSTATTDQIQAALNAGHAGGGGGSKKNTAQPSGSGGSGGPTQAAAASAGVRWHPGVKQQQEQQHQQRRQQPQRGERGGRLQKRKQLANLGAGGQKARARGSWPAAAAAAAAAAAVAAMTANPPQYPPPGAVQCTKCKGYHAPQEACRPALRCFNCDGEGHLKRDCTAPRKHNSKNKRANSAPVTVVFNTAPTTGANNTPMESRRSDQ